MAGDDTGVGYKESLINGHTLGRFITVDHYVCDLVAGERGMNHAG